MVLQLLSSIGLIGSKELLATLVHHLIELINRLILVDQTGLTVDLRKRKVAFIILFHCLISTQYIERLLRALTHVLQRMQAADGAFMVDPFACLT